MDSTFRINLKSKKKGIDRLVITDHNCLTNNFNEIKQFANKNSVEIPFQGTEVSCVYVENNEPKIKMHLLIYANNFKRAFLDFISLANKNVNEYIFNKYKELKSTVEELSAMRSFDKIYSISDANLQMTLPKKQFTRTPLAEEVAKILKISVEEAKEKYVVSLPRKDRYKDNNWLDIKNVIEECNKLGYVTILAHPAWIRNFNEDGRS